MTADSQDENPLLAQIEKWMVQSGWPSVRLMSRSATFATASIQGHDLTITMSPSLLVQSKLTVASINQGENAIVYVDSCRRLRQRMLRRLEDEKSDSWDESALWDAALDSESIPLLSVSEVLHICSAVAAGAISLEATMLGGRILATSGGVRLETGLLPLNGKRSVPAWLGRRVLLQYQPWT